MCLQKQFGLPFCSVEVGEALGLYHALIWTVDLRLDNMDFTLDSKLVVDAFIGDGNYITEFNSIVQSSMQMFSLYFQNSMIEFSRRQANGVAHVLAKEAHYMLAPMCSLIYHHVFLL